MSYQSGRINAMNTVSSRRQRYSHAFGALLGFGVLSYVLYTGLSMLAHWISPGVWGYIGAAGYLALIAPLPGLVVVRSWSRFLRRWGVLMPMPLTLALLQVSAFCVESCCDGAYSIDAERVD